MTGREIIDAWVHWQDEIPHRLLRMKPIARRTPLFIFEEDWARLAEMIDLEIGRRPSRTEGREHRAVAPLHSDGR